ncbi:hypothetical protein AB2F92_24950 (plasmid) [Escherichia coli]
MGFIAIESNAVRKIVSERMLQSADYEKGQILADVLKEQKKGDFSIDVKVVTTASGIYLLTKEPDKKRMLVFDTSNFNGFKRNSNEVITILQKSCRLAIKLWDKIGHSPCEKIISGSSLIALLPFSFTTGKSYKVILDKAPDKERQEKRNESSFLIFSDGYETTNNTPVLSNFRKAKDAINSIDTENLFTSPKKDEEKSSYLRVNETDVFEKSSNPHMGLSNWIKKLTESQKNSFLVIALVLIFSKVQQVQVKL